MIEDMTAAAMPATVVIPVRNGAATLCACLDALARQTVTGLEIIVVDDGSLDGSAEIAYRHGAHVVVQTRRGAAAARNRGVAHARGPIILFTDADCCPRSDWAEHMLAPFAEATVAGTKGVYASRQRSLVARFVQLEYEDRYRHSCRFASLDFVDTYSAAYRSSVLVHVGGFDEHFGSASVEDQELSFRVARAGYRMLFVPEAVVEHVHVPTVRGYVRKKFWIGYHKTAVHRRHPAKLLRDSHTPTSVRLQTLLALILAAGLFAMSSHRWARRLVMVAGSGLTISGLPFLIRTGRKDLEVGLVGPMLLAARAFALAGGLALGCTVALARVGAASVARCAGDRPARPDHH